MSAHMKTPRTRSGMAVISVKSSPHENTSFFEIPRAKLSDFMGALRRMGTPVDEDKTVPANEMFKALDKKYGPSGSVLRGARLKEGLTQKELSKKASIEQADLSKMENGKLSIGRDRAKRLGKVLNIDYRLFLVFVAVLLSITNIPFVWKHTSENNGVKTEIQVTGGVGYGIFNAVTNGSSVVLSTDVRPVSNAKGSSLFQ